MGEKYNAFKSDNGFWGVEDSKGGILYEAVCEFSEAQARYIADLHTSNNDLEWDSIAKVVELMDAKDTLRQAPVASADAAAGGANDSGYSELLDELSGRIKGLEREVARLRAALELAQGNERALAIDIGLLLPLFGEHDFRQIIDNRADHAEIWEVFNRASMSAQRSADGSATGDGG